MEDIASSPRFPDHAFSWGLNTVPGVQSVYLLCSGGEHPIFAEYVFQLTFPLGHQQVMS